MINDMAVRAVIIHELAHARAALAAAAQAGVAVEVWSAPGAAASAGAGWFDAVIRLAAADGTDVAVTAVLDCNDRADLAQAALRQGLNHVHYSGPEAVARRLADIARQTGATLHRRRPPALDLLYCDNPETACRAWLGGD
jgi:hypothetical protein